MAELAQKYQDQQKRIKQNIENASINFRQNNDRYHEFQRFVFQTAITADDESTLQAMGKPVIEFNINNAPVSRLCGEFSKQEPSIYVTAEEGAQVNPQLIEIIESHIRHILNDAQKRNTQYNVYRDQISGGFSVFKVWTEYAHEMSMDQVIKFGRVHNPTMCGFDPAAMEQDKSDGNYCYEIYPYLKSDFKRDYPDVDISDLQFAKQGEGFDWSFQTNGEDVVVVCDYFEKKKIRKKIAKLANGKVMTMDEYEKFVEEWMQSGRSEQPPAIVGKPRWTTITKVCRYRLTGTQVISYKETNFKRLPLVFVDGDSATIKEDSSAAFKQFTKPYVYHTKGIQRLTNFAGQVIGNDFESMVMHKFKVAKEGLPQEEEYLEAYKNPQLAQTLVYQAFADEDPDKPIPPPQEIARVPLPPEVMNLFNTSMQMMQNILGSYDASLGINDNQLSGLAIVEGATQSNSAAMPYVVNYMHSLNTVAQSLLDLIPKYLVTERDLPLISKEGKRGSVKINGNNSNTFDYADYTLSIRVEAGVNFTIAKDRAMKQITALMQASPLFAQFMNQVGLPFLLDNLEFRGSDILKTKAEAWIQQMQQQAQQQPNPEEMQAQQAQQEAQMQMQLAQQKLQLDSQKAQSDAQLKAQQISVDNKKADTDRLEVMIDAGDSQQKMQVEIAKAQAEEVRAQADLHLRHIDMGIKHADISLKHGLALHDRLTKDEDDATETRQE